MRTLTSNHQPSYFEKLTGRTVAPIWFLRGFTIAAILPLLLAMFVWKSGASHDFCIGLSVGTLIGLLVQTFAISNVDLNSAPQPSDVQDLRMTR
jgi:hypothetical protein